MMGFGYRLYPSYNGYNSVGGKGIDKMIDQLNAKHDELPALPTARRLLFFSVALAERRSRLLTEYVQGLRTAFREVKQAHPFTLEAVVMWRVVFIRWIGVEMVVLMVGGILANDG